MDQIRVLVANDHPIVRSGLRSLLERDSRIRVVAEAATGREATMLAEHQHPDVVILDVRLSLTRCIDAARVISAMNPRRQVLILGELTDEGYVSEAFNAGARGYVLSDAVQTDLQRAVLVLMAGGAFLSPVASQAVIADWIRVQSNGNAALSERQQYLFSLLAEGRLAAEIAQMLTISEEQLQQERAELKKSLEGLEISQVLLAGN